MSKKKSSPKTTVDDFLSLLMEEQSSSQPVAFAPTQNTKQIETIDNPLDSRETGVRSALDSRETGVSSALDKMMKKVVGVSSALDKPLDNRETGVRKIETSALEIGQLVGKEKSLLLIIHDECKKLGELETNFIGTDYLKNLLSLDSLGLRNLIFRVKEKGFFEVTSKQLGRVGLRKFKISRTIYQQILSLALDSHETGVSSALDKPLDKPLETAPYSSNKLNINITTIELPENLRRFGISVVNLQNLVTSGKTTQEVIERSLSALSFDVENGKTGNLANILFGVLGSGREYISQKYSETLQAELDQELARIAQAEENQKRSAELQLASRFKEYLSNNPEFLETVRSKHKGFVASNELLEKVAFEEFKSLSLEN